MLAIVKLSSSLTLVPTLLASLPLRYRYGFASRASAARSAGCSFTCKPDILPLNCLQGISPLKERLADFNLVSLHGGCTANTSSNANHLLKSSLVRNFAFENNSTASLGNPKTPFRSE